MWKKLLQIGGVMLLSGVKFLGGAPLSFACKFSFLETMAYTSAGAFTGVILITYFSKNINYGVSALIGIFKRKAVENSTIDSYPVEASIVDDNVDVTYIYKKIPVIGKKRIFTSRNRRIITLKTKYGLAGIAFLTPVLLSIPIGTFIATKLVHNKSKIILYMAVSISFWALVYTSILKFFFNS